MAIPAQNLTYLTQGPSATGQEFAASPTGMLEVALIGTATFVLDGALTSATLNFIDGTSTVLFGPPITSGGVLVPFPNNASAVTVQVIGGTQPAAAYISASADTITTTGCTVRFSIAGTNTNTVKLLVTVYR